MSQSEKIKTVIEVVRKKYNLDQYKMDRAIIQAPFGQKHFDEGIKKLTDSKAVRELAGNGSTLILVLTSKETKVGSLPDWIKCIQVDKVPDWPEHPTYQNRFFKWAISFLFPKIKTSFYLDSDIVISQRRDKLLRFFKEVEQKNFLVTQHPSRKGWKDEYEDILKGRCLCQKKIELQYKFYIKEGLPGEFEVYQNKLIGRVHHSELNILCSEVLNQLKQFSERDQLALPYAYFKHEKKPFAEVEGKFLAPFSGDSGPINFKTLAFADKINEVRNYLANDDNIFWSFFWKLRFKKH